MDNSAGRKDSMKRILTRSYVIGYSEFYYMVRSISESSIEKWVNPFPYTSLPRIEFKTNYPYFESFPYKNYLKNR